MILTAFRAENFRCLLKTPWIPIHDLTVLIGENDGGKTATLDAISLFLNPSRKPDENDYSNLVEKKEVVFEGNFIFNDSEKEQIPKNYITNANSIVIKRKFIPENPSPFLVEAHIPSDPRLSVNLSNLTVEMLTAFADDFSLIIPKSPKSAIISAINDYISQQPLIKGEIEIIPAIKQYIPEFETFNTASEPQRVITQMLSRVFKDEINKEEIAGRLSEIESKISEQLRAKASSLKKFVQQYRPKVEDVTVESQFNFENGLQGAEIQIKEKGKTYISLNKSGTGMQHHVRLAVYEWNSGIIEKRTEEGAKSVVWAFDEPDIHLDYKCQRKLFDIIQTFVRNEVQVIICTHSINLINRVPITNLVHYSLDNSGVTQIAVYEPTSENEDFFLNQIGINMGLDNSLMFYERCFISIEGEMELCSLPLLFKKLTGNSNITEGIRLINGENNGGARLFAKYLNEKHKNVVLLVDEDCKTNSPVNKLFTAERLEKDGFDLDSQVYFAGPKEYEYCFSPAIWAKVGNHLDSKNPEGKTWTSEDISKLSQPSAYKFADKLRASFKVDTMKLAMALGTCVDKEEIPDVIRNCFTKALEIANSGGK